MEGREGGWRGGVGGHGARAPCRATVLLAQPTAHPTPLPQPTPRCSWEPNQAEAFWAPHPLGPWASLGSPAAGATPAQRQAAMRAANPAFIPRNHRVQAVITAAQAGDFALLDEMVGVLARPYDDQPGFEIYAQPPQPEEVVHRTFCGT